MTVSRWLRMLVRTTGQLWYRPNLWVVAVVQLFAFAPNGWWRRWPFLPIPDRKFWRFRMETAYADPDAEPPTEDIIDLLRWSKEMRRERRRPVELKWDETSKAP